MNADRRFTHDKVNFDALLNKEQQYIFDIAAENETHKEKMGFYFNNQVVLKDYEKQLQNET